MKKLAFIFSQVPHGRATGREALDILLAMSAYFDHIAVFFIGDGVFQLLAEQQPEVILARNYISTFKLLSLYDIEQCYVCYESLLERGIETGHQLLIDTEPLSYASIREKLAQFDTILTF